MAIVVEILKDINKLCRTCMNIIEDDDDNNVIVEGGDLCKMLKYVTSLNVRSLSTIYNKVYAFCI